LFCSSPSLAGEDAGGEPGFFILAAARQGSAGTLGALQRRASLDENFRTPPSAETKLQKFSTSCFTLSSRLPPFYFT